MNRLKPTPEPSSLKVPVQNHDEPPTKRSRCECKSQRRRTVSFQEQDVTYFEQNKTDKDVMGTRLCTFSSKNNEPPYKPSTDDAYDNPDGTVPLIKVEITKAMPEPGKSDDNKSLPDSTVTTPTSTFESRVISRNLSSGNNDTNLDPNGKYTLEEVNQQLQIRFTRLLVSENFSDDTATADLRFIKRRTNYSPSNTLRLRIADKMDELGVIQLFMRIWQLIHADNCVAQDASPGLNNLVQVVSTVWNISDISRSLCEKISRSGILEQIVQDLNSGIFSLDKLSDDTRMYYVKGVFGILHNICRHCRDSREILRGLGAVDALQRYLCTDAEAEVIHCRVLLILCYLINEHENNIIHADDSHIHYIVNILKSAVESKGHFSRKYGFSASEILCGLNHLAANDCNKQRIVDSGGLPLYVELLQPSCNTDEQKTAARGLWTLAFSEACKGYISSEQKAISSLQWLVSNSTDERVRHGARGALWEVSARWRVSSQSHEQDKLVSNTQHIMISYQWDSKPTMLKVKDALQSAGYKVWMDVQNMSGSTLEAMALAVERAAAVIVCLSQKYKDSPNCRSEAEYSYRLRKRVIPLVLEHNYCPDGWLGIMIGTRLYFDFSQDQLFDTSFEGLAKELGETGKVGTHTRSSPASEALVPTVNELTSPETIDSITPDFVLRQSSQISQASVFSAVSSVQSSTTTLVQIPFCDLNSWLADNDLGHQSDRLSTFSVDLLREMKEVQRECPKFLYKSLQNEYGLGLVDVLKISRALRRTIFP